MLSGRAIVLSDAQSYYQLKPLLIFPGPLYKFPNPGPCYVIEDPTVAIRFNVDLHKVTFNLLGTLAAEWCPVEREGTVRPNAPCASTINRPTLRGTIEAPRFCAKLYSNRHRGLQRFPEEKQCQQKTLTTLPTS